MFRRVALYVNSLWPSDEIWQHSSGSVLAPVMACCLTAPGLNLNLNWHLWHSPESNFTANAQANILYNEFANHTFKVSATCSRGQWDWLLFHWPLEHVAVILKLLLINPSHHDDVIKWKHFPRYWPFVRGIYRSPGNSPHKGQWHVALMFSLICAWINGWENNREAGDLRRYGAHYVVIVMNKSH